MIQTDMRGKICLATGTSSGIGKGAFFMQPLEEFLSKQSEITIQTLASYIQQYIQEQWQPVLQKGKEELLRLYDKAGEGAVYGTYAHRLFQPVQEQLKRDSRSFNTVIPKESHIVSIWVYQTEIIFV